MPEADNWGVFVDELKIFATGSPGAGWWALYLSRQPDGRVTYLAHTPSGGHVHVACDSKDDAEMLLGTITDHGVSPKFVKVATLEACQKEAGRRAERQAAADARQAEWDESHRKFREAWQWWVNNVQPDPLTDEEGSRRALAGIGYPSRGFEDAVLRLYQDHKASLQRPDGNVIDALTATKETTRQDRAAQAGPSADPAGRLMRSSDPASAARGMSDAELDEAAGALGGRHAWNESNQREYASSAVQVEKDRRQQAARQAAQAKADAARAARDAELMRPYQEARQARQAEAERGSVPKAGSELKQGDLVAGMTGTGVVESTSQAAGWTRIKFTDGKTAQLADGETLPVHPAADADAGQLHSLAAAHGMRVITAGQGADAETLVLPEGGGAVTVVLRERGGRITAANGEKIAPGEVDAYLTAYRQHPRWLSSALVDHVRGSTGLRVGDAVWHPDGPAIGTVRETDGDTARVTFRDLPEKRVPVAELAVVSPGDPVTVAIRHSPPRIGDTRSTFTVRAGEYVGPVLREPSLSHVRIGGDLRRVPTEYLSVPGPAGQAATRAWRHRLAAPRAAGPGRKAGSQDPADARSTEAKAEAAQDKGNHAAGAASLPDACPLPVRPAAPETDGAEARQTAGPRSGRQVTPRGRGRAG